MDNALYAFMDVVNCNMPCVCENASMSVNPHNCDDMLLEFMGVVNIPNVKLLKKKFKKFHENLNKFTSENDDLIAKLNESNKLVEKYKKLVENYCEKLKKFECFNMELDVKLVLSNNLVDDLKYENESLQIHAKYLIAEPSVKNEENLYCNHIVVPNFVPIMCFTSNDKSMYIPPHKRNQKVERKALKPKPPFRSQSKVLDGSKFVLTCQHCSVIGHIRPQRPKVREQNHVARSLPKKPSGPKHIVCHHFGTFDHLRPHCYKFQALKRIKRKEKLELFGSCAIRAKPVLGDLIEFIIEASY